MPIAHPTSLTEVYDALDDLPDAHLLAGGTDFMVEVNFGHRRPTSVVCLRRVDELQGYSITDDEVVLGAGTPGRRSRTTWSDVLPALAAAARTVGSPQMRNAGTVGGNVGTASPAGDGLPVLAAMDATVVLARREGTRELPLLEFITGVKRTGIEPGEVIWQIKVPRLDGPQEFLKVGTRNAMVISIVCCALIMDRVGRTVRLGLGSVSPRPLRATDAEAFAAEAMDWEALSAPPDAIARFGELAQQAATPDLRPAGHCRLPRACGRRHRCSGAGAECGGMSQQPSDALHDPTTSDGALGISDYPTPHTDRQSTVDYALTVNGREMAVTDAWIGESLLYALRERLGLPGSKNACEQGECGSCSALLDGRLVATCCVLAADAVGSDIRTVEGLARRAS